MPSIINFQPLQPGVSSAGDGFPLTGQLRNVSGAESTRQAVRVAWTPEAVDTARVYSYVDGQLRADMAASAGVVNLAYMAAGDNSVQLLAGLERENAPTVLIDPLGQNAFLSWPASPDADCVGYRIRNVATGALVTVSDMATNSRSYALPDTGTGTGRIQIFGAPTATVNGVLSIVITGAGTATWSFNGGAATAIEFIAGTVTLIALGVSAGFHDDPALYEIGDTWLTTVGPVTNYTTDALMPGTHTFAVAAIDAAGNLSAEIVTPGIYIVTLPGAIIDPVTAYNAGALTVSWTLPAGVDGVRVYTNYNPHTGLFEDYIATDGLPFATIAAAVNQWTFDPWADGALKYYLRPYNAETERDEGLLYGFNFPPEPIDLGVLLRDPTGLVATPTAGGTWRLEWDFRSTPAHAVTQFNIYRHATDTPINYATDLVYVIDYTAGVGRPVRHFTYNHVTAETGQVRLAVRASNGTLETTNTDYVLLTPDAAAPTLTGSVIGGSV